VENLALGQNPFGIKGVFGKGAKKELLKQVRVLEQAQLQDPEAWRHVLHFLEHRRRLRQCAVRWIALANESGLDALAGTEPEHGLAALQQYRLFEMIVDLVSAEKSVSARAEKLFPSFEPSRRVLSDVRATRLLADALQNHIAKNRLSIVWATKEQFQKVLQGKTGPIVAGLHQFLTQTLGNSSIGDTHLQTGTAFMRTRQSSRSADALAVAIDVTAILKTGPSVGCAIACLAMAIDLRLPDTSHGTAVVPPGNHLDTTMRGMPRRLRATGTGGSWNHAMKKSQSAYY
jgi:hypothetical protein